MAAGHLDDLVKNESIQPRWIDDETLQYTVETREKQQQRRISAISGRILDTPPETGDPAALTPSRADRSVGQGNDIQLQFVNDLDVSLRLFWLDQQGRRRAYGAIPSEKNKIGVLI